MCRTSHAIKHACDEKDLQTLKYHLVNNIQIAFSSGALENTQPVESTVFFLFTQAQYLHGKLFSS